MSASKALKTEDPPSIYGDVANKQLIAEQNDLNREVIAHRRQLIFQEFVSSGRLCEGSCANSFSHQASIEILSARDFRHPNMLLSISKPKLVIRYKLLKPNDQLVLLKGQTNAVQNSNSMHDTFEFTVHFAFSFIVVILVVVFVLGGISTLIFFIAPLALVFRQGSYKPYHLNHQFTTMFNDENSARLVLELNAVLYYNDMEYRMGCAAVDIPIADGNQELEISTWIPVARSSLGDRSRLHYFYLGASLNGIGPADPAQTASKEQDLAKMFNTSLLSKHDLSCEKSGIIRVRVSIAKNRFRRDEKTLDDLVPMRSQSRRVFLRETADEVLSRVRKNKRLRMASLYNKT